MAKLLFFIMFSIAGFPLNDVNTREPVPGLPKKIMQLFNSFSYPAKLFPNNSFERKDSASLIIEKYVSTIGGKENLHKVKDRTIILEAAIEGIKGSISIYQKYPDKYLQITSVNGVEQRIIYNGSKGFQRSELGTKELAGKLLDQLRIDAIFNFVLDYSDYGIKANFGGIENINDRQAYRINYLLPDSTVLSDYFDIDTGFKIRQVKTFIGDNNEVEQISDFDNYTVVEGIKYPFRIKQMFGPLKTVIKVISIKVNQDLNDEIFEPGE